jgi:hypothetical protein
MGHHSLTFSDLLNRITLIGGHVVRHPPAPAGGIWLFGKGGGTFPWTRSPIYPVRERPDDEPIPGVMVDKILKKLGLGKEDQAAFWNIQTHISPKPPQNSN